MQNQQYQVWGFFLTMYAQLTRSIRDILNQRLLIVLSIREITEESSGNRREEISPTESLQHANVFNI